MAEVKIGPGNDKWRSGSNRADELNGSRRLGRRLDPLQGFVIEAAGGAASAAGFLAPIVNLSEIRVRSRSIAL